MFSISVERDGEKLASAEFDDEEKFSLVVEALQPTILQDGVTMSVEVE